MNYKMHMMCIKAKLNDYIIILNNHIISYVEQIKNLYMFNHTITIYMTAFTAHRK